MSNEKKKKKSVLFTNIYKQLLVASQLAADSSFRRPGRNVLFLATPSGSLPWRERLASVVLPVSGGRAGESSLIVCSLEGVQRLARGTVVS